VPSTLAPSGIGPCEGRGPISSRVRAFFGLHRCNAHEDATPWGQLDRLAGKGQRSPGGVGKVSGQGPTGSRPLSCPAKDVPFGGCVWVWRRLSWRRGWAVPCALIGFLSGPPRYRPRLQVAAHLWARPSLRPAQKCAVRLRRRTSAPGYDGPIIGTDAPGQHGTVSCFLSGRAPYYLPARPSLCPHIGRLLGILYALVPHKGKYRCSSGDVMF